tara:strand:+ start:1035 stop:1490 length:456 start_codon:yes stop_codon:yes gene_type:complete
VLIAYSGILTGMLLIFMGPEERKPGEKYFKIMQDVVLFLIMFFLFFNLGFDYFLIAGLMLGVLLILFWYRAKKIYLTEKYFIVYTLLGVVLHLSSQNGGFLITGASLIFLYGMPTGSLLTNSKKKLESLRGVLKYSYFILVAMLPFLFSKP